MLQVVGNALAALAALAAIEASDEPGFEYLRATEYGFVSTHDLPYRFEADDSFVAAGPKHRTDRFNDVPFEISLAAFVREDAAVMVHAERVADGSSASDYSRFPEDSWPDGNFRLSPPKCLQLEAGELAGDHDPDWLAAQGFEFEGTLYLRQYFASTTDHNEEVVISFIQRVDHCAEGGEPPPGFYDLQSQIKVTRE